MRIKNLFIAVAFLCILSTTYATVFEAESSEDVDLFLKENEQETIALFFYDSEVDNTKNKGWFSSLSSKVLGVFMSRDQYGRENEDWVEMFDDKLHLMRIDVRNPDLLRTKEEFNIEKAPYIVIQENQRTILREDVDENTYDHVREVLDKRPNIENKTGGAALKSFNLEPDADTNDTEPKTIQYFDLEEGEPTNIEPPVEDQVVNWAPDVVMGSDGAWEERGRGYIPKFDIPESGIKNQENPEKVKISERTRDDPRGKSSRVSLSSSTPTTGTSKPMRIPSSRANSVRGANSSKSTRVSNKNGSTSTNNNTKASVKPSGRSLFIKQRILCLKSHRCVSENTNKYMCLNLNCVLFIYIFFDSPIKYKLILKLFLITSIG